MLPQLKEESLQREPRGVKKATTGVGCDGFHPKVLMDFSKAATKEVVQTAASVHDDVLLDPEECYE